MDHFIQWMGLVGGVVMPLWNIPLIIRIVRRKSSGDISLAWAAGVWVCVLLMFPSGIRSTDIVLKAFNISNTLFFTAVFFTVFKYRERS